MAFLVVPELSTEVWCFWRSVPSELSESWSIPCRGRGLRGEEKGPPWTAGGLSGDCAPPVRSGPLPPSTCSWMTAGSSSLSALSLLWLSLSALNGICSGQSSWAHLSVMRGLRMPISSRDTRRVALPTRDTEQQATFKQGAETATLSSDDHA